IEPLPRCNQYFFSGFHILESKYTKRPADAGRSSYYGLIVHRNGPTAWCLLGGVESPEMRSE
ncbi:MAG: hypothetical protein AAGM67_14560, partial [Bacteroidota bacterium]